LKEIGVDSFKIEGRLKGPQYVASTAKSNREAIDSNLSFADLEKLKEDMSVSYSRGFFPGWLHGVNHQDLVDGTFSSHRGLEIGSVLKINKNSIIVSSSRDLENGDGLLFASVSEKPKKEIGA